MEKNEVKLSGVVYTPDDIVEHMLDFTGYYGNPIIKKHVIDNSCGDGRFLVKIVGRYIEEATRENISKDRIALDIEKYVHGIEINEAQCELCKKNISEVASKRGISVNMNNLDIICGNSLTIKKYDGKMNYVYGNPPYVRIQNIKKRTGNEQYDILKSYSFTKNGAGDLYIAFYELGLRMLTDGGTMCYIAPSSWLTSSAGEPMRKHIIDNKVLHSVVDFEHKQVFNGVNTYSLITAFKKKKLESVECYDKDWRMQYSIPYSELLIDGKFYLANETERKKIAEISSCEKNKIRVKNGIATLSDSIFIDNCPDTSMSISIIKCSTEEEKRCLYPHYQNGETIPLSEIRDKYPIAYTYIMENEEELKNRTYDGECWHAIGRKQGLSDINKEKIYINNLINEPGNIKVGKIPAGSHVYSGYYITGENITDIFAEIDMALKSTVFFDYVKSLRKYKSGGYYTFSTKDVEKFLNWKLID